MTIDYRCLGIKFFYMIFYFIYFVHFVFLYLIIYLNDSGLCIPKGRVLTDDELKKSFLINLKNMNLNNFNEWEKIYPDHGSIVGIIPEYDDINFIDVINESFNNDMSFEENFHIEIIYSSAIKVDTIYPYSKFVLVHYGARNDQKANYGNSTAYFESDVKKVDSSLISEDRFYPSIFQRLYGYGNNFFSIKVTIIKIDCCDNKRYGQSEIDYMKMKINAYKQSKKWISDSIKYGNRITAAVSNCGEILTRNTDNGMDTEEIDRI